VDDEVVDRLARRVGTLGSRRAALGILAGTGLAAALDLTDNGATAKRKRRKKKKKVTPCTPDPRATTCAGKCGSVANNCQTPVNCGGCPTCQRCDAATASCKPDQSQQGNACGQTGQICLANGTCACDASSCGSNTVCLNGSCQPCGLADDPCCSGNACRQAFLVCTPAGICVLCGRDGEPCCRANPNDIGTCDAGRVCAANDTCVRCGDIGQPCCTVGNPCFAGTCNGVQCVE
jgi:hypothetical protein